MTLFSRDCKRIYNLEFLKTGMKYFKQETEYTCGCAAMRMVLFENGVKRSEKQLMKLMKTNKVRGTWAREFPLIAEKFKMNYCVSWNSKVKDIEEMLAKGYSVIVCYFYEDSEDRFDHYAVVKSIDSRNIVFYDPYFGEGHKMKLSEFRKAWHMDPKFGGENGWFFAVKKE